MPVRPPARLTLPERRSTGSTRTSFSQLGEALGRGGVVDLDEPGQVFPQREVERDGVRRLLLLAARERRAVALGEDGKADADDEERRRDGRVARVARQREGGEAQPDRPSAGCALEQEQAWAQEARADDRGDEGDEPGQEDERGGRARLLGQGLLVEVAAEQRDAR